MGFRQFALRTATVEAPEDGVLVAASVYAKRLAGTEAPRIAVLRPASDGVTLDGRRDRAGAGDQRRGRGHARRGLHLPVERGDSIGFLFRAGEVDLGVRTRPRPDGAIQWFDEPCDPCGSDGGTGTELLFDATVEPDVDDDGMGDETQDPDGGGLGLDWVDDWFDDFNDGDELDEDFDDFGPTSAAARAAHARPARAPPPARRPRHALLRVPKAGRVNVSVTLPANRRTGEGPFTTVLTGDMRVQPRRAACACCSTRPSPAPRDRQAQADADEGRRRLLPAQVDPGAADALRPAVMPGWTSGTSTR